MLGESGEFNGESIVPLTLRGTVPVEIVQMVKQKQPSPNALNLCGRWDPITSLTLFVKDIVTEYFKKCWNKPSERSLITHLDLFMYLLFVSGIFDNNK
jgi:hypothetical protein